MNVAGTLVLVVVMLIVTVLLYIDNDANIKISGEILRDLEAIQSVTDPHEMEKRMAAVNNKMAAFAARPKFPMSLFVRGRR